MAPSSRSEAGDGRAHRRTEPGRTYQVPKCTAAAPRRTDGQRIRWRHAPMGVGHRPFPAARCRRSAARRVRRRRGAVVRSRLVRAPRTARPRRLPGARGAGPDVYRGDAAGRGRFRPELQRREPRVAWPSRVRGSPIRGGDLEIWRGAFRGAGRLQRSGSGRRRSCRLLRAKRARGAPRGDPCRNGADDRRAPGSPAGREAGGPPPDRRRLAGGGTGRRQRRRQQRPARCADPGSHRRVRGRIAEHRGC